MAKKIERICPTEKEFTVVHFFAGIGGLALGFKEAQYSYKGITGRFRNICGIDSDKRACEDFEMLTGAPAVCMDLFSRTQYIAYHQKDPPEGWKEVTGADIRRATGNVKIDILALSPPCKGFSGLLSAKKAASPKYQALNALALRGYELMLDAFKDDLPALIITENVPRIASARGAHLLTKIKTLLAAHNYTFAEGVHDAGEYGGLGQRRKRYLLVARLPEKLPCFLYQPYKKRVKSIGEVIGALPLPDDPSAGPMHRLPRLKWKTLLRLALIPAGGDWRSLAEFTPKDAKARKRWEQKGIRTKGEKHLFKGKYAVIPWSVPSRTVIGGSSNGAGYVADPRLTFLPRGRGCYGVQDWNKPGATVIANGHVSGSNAVCVADPRLTPKSPKFNHAYKVADWDLPSPTIASGGGPSSGAVCVADPLFKGDKNRHRSHFRVVPYDEPAGTVTGSTHVANGSICVQDVRAPQAIEHYNNAHIYRIVEINGDAGNLPAGSEIAEPPPFQCAMREGNFMVQNWNDSSKTVTGSLNVHAGAAAVADPRDIGKRSKQAPPITIIISADGTWHRCLTSLELAALQGFAVQDENGNPLVLSGTSDSRFREAIGNAVPPPAATAIAEFMLIPLLANIMGDFLLGSTEIWVQPDSGESTNEMVVSFAKETQSAEGMTLRKENQYER